MRAYQARKRMAVLRAVGAAALTGGLVLGGAERSAFAEDPLIITGFGSYVFNIKDEFGEDPIAGENLSENRTSVEAEIDVEKNWPELSGRIDLNLPADGLEAQTTNKSSWNDLGLEQARFDWHPNRFEPFRLTLTGGLWNMPNIGLTHQDPTERFFTRDSLLSELHPRNFAGYRLSGGTGPANVGLFKGNEWHGEPDEWSYGADFNVNLDRLGELRGGVVAGTKDDVGDETVYNVNWMGHFLHGLGIGLEYTADKNNSGLGVEGHFSHDMHGFNHGIGLRYEMLSADAGSDFIARRFGASIPEEVDVTEFTATAMAEVIKHLQFRLEGTWETAEAGDEEESHKAYTLEALYRF